MKKVIYVVIVLVILLVLSMLLKGTEVKTEDNAPAAVAEVVVEEKVDANVPAEDSQAKIENEGVEPLQTDAVVVDVEPTVGEAVVEENVVEEDPATTADEGETIVE